jgi:hypothetical protein
MEGRGVQGKTATIAACIAAALLVLAGPGPAGLGTDAASAGPIQRAGDPVVFTGSEVPSMLGAKPGRVVAFAWKSGRWIQIPVQVDERKTIDVRDLYPTPGPPYVRVADFGFPLEVYADPDTRTGADPARNLDADDEIALMSQDAGNVVASGTVPRPSGTEGSAAQVSIEDPLSGGRGTIYLFRASRAMDQSAGRSYVDYDFRPLYLEPGQALRDGYRYLNSPNPEDSTVRTGYYEIHSTDRWMDDEVRVRAGGTTGPDILDREVAQATRTSCGRSELTFSGNWTVEDRGSDTDEGTFIAVKSGPIRAIRDYMGANSGPYTQRQHIYYQRREDTTTFLRVHPMLDLYTWTDWSSAAVGMTYRNEANPSGVPVDGSPDTLTQPDTAEFVNGATFWEQLSGPQGTVSTIASAQTDIDNASFGSYYLDDANAPLTGNRRQCAGDGLSYGASGFGILGPVTPNTDPRLPGAKSLTVARVRYFGSPGQDSADAARLAERVGEPLRVSSRPFRTRPSAELAISVKPLKVQLVGRGRGRVTVRVSNVGDRAARSLRVCLTPDDSARSCSRSSTLPAGRTVRIRVLLELGRTRPGAPVWTWVRASASGAEPVRAPYRLVARR